VVTLRDSGQTDRAILVARDVLVRKSGDAGALAELALCHLSKGEKDVAMLLVKQAIEADGKSAAARRAEGPRRALAGATTPRAFRAFQARRRRRRVRQHEPREHGRGAPARRSVRQGRRTSTAPSSTATPRTRAPPSGSPPRCEGESENKPGPKAVEARQLLEGVLAREPHHATAAFNLAVLYADVFKDGESAKKYFRVFLRNAPKHHAARAEAERYLAASPQPGGKG
jgi:tetratricopeptide (TPR) repeat protein